MKKQRGIALLELMMILSIVFVMTFLALTMAHDAQKNHKALKERGHITERIYLAKNDIETEATEQRNKELEKHLQKESAPDFIYDTYMEPVTVNLLNSETHQVLASANIIYHTVDGKTNRAEMNSILDGTEAVVTHQGDEFAIDLIEFFDAKRDGKEQSALKARIFVSKKGADSESNEKYSATILMPKSSAEGEKNKVEQKLGSNYKLSITRG